MMAQVIPASYKNRIVKLEAEGNKLQHGFIVSERNNRLYIITILTKPVEEYPIDILAIMNDGQRINGRWYKDDKALKNANLMLLSIPKPTNYKLDKITYFTRPVPGQLVALQSGNSPTSISFRISGNPPSTIKLNPASYYKPSDEIIGAPVYLPDRGLIGVISSADAININTTPISVVRDAIRKDDSELFDPEPFNRESDEIIVTNVGETTPVTNSEEITNRSTYPGGKTPTVSEEPDKVHRLRFGVGLGLNFVPKPASPAFDNQNKVKGYISFTLNFRLFQRLILHADPRWNKYQVVFAKDSKYANYALTHMDMESLEIPVGFDYHFSNKANTFFLRIDGSVSNTIAGKYEYIFQGKTYTVPLRSNQKTWQRAAIIGLGAKSKQMRLLVSYYYALDPFINSNELTNTVPQVTPFKQQQTSLKYVSLELGFYF
ncbi:outer membrane beta-barrel protein [Larkinella knui]|nr:outer membrane beta-barrel protein [Larkinella knui]